MKCRERRASTTNSFRMHDANCAAAAIPAHCGPCRSAAKVSRFAPDRGVLCVEQDAHVLATSSAGPGPGVSGRYTLYPLSLTLMRPNESLNETLDSVRPEGMVPPVAIPEAGAYPLQLRKLDAT